jgi:hypothetical protein
MAIGFAALAETLGKRPAQKPFAGNDLSDAGTEIALGRREFGATERGVHILYK